MSAPSTCPHCGYASLRPPQTQDKRSPIAGQSFCPRCNTFVTPRARKKKK